MKWKHTTIPVETGSDKERYWETDTEPRQTDEANKESEYEVTRMQRNVGFRQKIY